MRYTRRLASVATICVLSVVLTMAVAAPAAADTVTAAVTLEQAIANLQKWLVGFLVALATLFLTIGGIRYLVANGDPGAVEKAKSALRSAAIGYALAAMATPLVKALQSIVG